MLMSKKQSAKGKHTEKIVRKCPHQHELVSSDDAIVMLPSTSHRLLDGFEVSRGPALASCQGLANQLQG